MKHYVADLLNSCTQYLFELNKVKTALGVTVRLNLKNNFFRKIIILLLSLLAGGGGGAKVLDKLWVVRLKYA